MTESSLTEKPTGLSLTEDEQIDDVVYQCPEGDYENENFNSVRAHCQRKHRYRIELVNGMVKKIEPAEKRLQRPAKREVSILKAPTVPDALLTLQKKLMTYGLSQRDSNAVVDYMSSYDVDDLFALDRALTNIGMARPRRLLFMGSWITERGIPIGPKLAKELGLDREFTPRPTRRSWYERGYPSSEEDLRQGGTILHGMANVIRAMKETEGAKTDPELMRQLGRLETEVEHITKNPPINAGNDQVIAGLQTQVSELSKKLDEEKERRLFDKIDNLTKEVQDVKSRATSAESAYGVLNTSIVSLKELAKEYFEIAKAAMGFKSSSKPPTREKVEMPKDVESPLQQLAREHPELVE